MKKLSIYLCVLFTALLFTSCEEDLIVYNGENYVIFEGTSASISESAAARTITVLRSNADDALSAEIGVNSYFANSTSTSADASFSLSSTSISFAAGEFSTTFTITPVDDIDASGAKIVELTFNSLSQSGVSAGFPGASAFNGTFTVTLVDDDCPFDITAFAATFNANEPGYGDYDVTFTQVDANTIVANNFWDFGGVVNYDFNTNSSTPEVTLPAQDVVMGGTTYRVIGTNTDNGTGADGTYESCTGNFTVNYRVYDATGTVLQDDNTHTFTKK